MLRVVRGQADDDEIAALVTALAVATASPTPPPARSTAPPSEWARPLRTTAGAPASRGGWRRSGLPAHRTW